MLSGYVEFDGYYLESDPCLVCNNPEVPFQVRQQFCAFHTWLICLLSWNQSGGNGKESRCSYILSFTYVAQVPVAKGVTETLSAG